MLSHHTSEPTFGTGYIRPRNDVLASDEIKRGISARLDIEEDGLLKPDAVASEKVESFTGTSVHKEAISRSSPRIGIDAENLESFSGGSSSDMIVVNTEAHSLHTDRNIGQRVILHGGMQAASQTLGDYDLTALTFAGQPQGGVMRFSHTSNIHALGGNYILESSSFANPFDDTGWGLSSWASASEKTSNPYQVYNSGTVISRYNYTDKSIQFLLRPTRLLDNKHVEVFRPNLALHSSSPQSDSNYFSATSGGKYGLFNYSTPSATSTNFSGSDLPASNAPYQPVYYVKTSSSVQSPASKGPKLPGTEATGFDKTSLKGTVTRLVISENTLQKFRGDSSRSDGSEKDYNVKARFTQSLHSKGHKEDVTFNTSDHSGDA